MSDDLYQEQLLAEYTHPQHQGKLSTFTHQAKYVNASCGDRFEATLNIDKSGRIQDVGWEGEGCAVSIAAMSVLSANIIGSTTEKVQGITSQHVAQWLGLSSISPSRVKCVEAGLSTIQHAIEKGKKL